MTLIRVSSSFVSIIRYKDEEKKGKVCDAQGIIIIIKLIYDSFSIVSLVIIIIQVFFFQLIILTEINKS